MAIQLPDVIAMVFADDIHHDSTTRKFYVIGTYSSLAAPAFPWRQRALIVYLAFTDGKGKVPLKIRLVDATEAQPAIFESEFTMQFPDPTTVMERAFFETDVVYPQAGEYRLQLFAGGELLRERRLVVRFGSLNGRR